jgi:hypothetical protein
MGDEEKEDDELVTTIGGLKIDWPRAVGYYGAIGAAVAFDVIAPPLGAFIALVPLLKLLKRRRASRLERIAAAVVEGAGKPVGGDAEGVVRLTWIDEEKDAKATRARLDEGRKMTDGPTGPRLEPGVT